MINIAICDDDLNNANEIKGLICDKISMNDCSISIYIDGEKFLSSDFCEFDMVFLDIEMGKISGIDIATQIRDKNENVIIFFVTSHFRYISEALKSMPFQYILKPLNEKKELFYQEFERGIKRLKKIRNTLTISMLGGEEILRVDTLVYIESLNRSIIIHTDNKEVEILGRLNEWVKKLTPFGFVQCHKSFIVNLNRIEKIKHNKIVMENKKIIPIGRKYLQSFKETRNKFMAGVII